MGWSRVCDPQSHLVLSRLTLCTVLILGSFGSVMAGNVNTLVQVHATYVSGVDKTEPP
jgi:hypothetical protein